MTSNEDKYNNLHIFKRIEKFKQQLKFLKQIKLGDKIRKDSENNIIIEPEGFSQSFKRWYYGESFNTTTQYLNEIFNDFFQFIDNCIINNQYISNSNISSNTSNSSNSSNIMNSSINSVLLYNLSTKVITIIKEIIYGLDILTKTYNKKQDYELYSINLIIYKLLNVKNTLNDIVIQTNKNLSKRKTSF